MRARSRHAARRRVPPRVGRVRRMRGRLRPRPALEPRHARARCSTRCAPRAQAGAAPLRLVFSSSVAVFGPDPAVPLPAVVADDTLPTPQTSYGTQKLMCEHLIADYTRKGYIDGRAARLMTVTVRPGPAERARPRRSSPASSASRSPAWTSVCPVSPTSSHPVSSPARTIDGLIAVYEASREPSAAAPRINLPALNVTRRARCSTRSRRWPATRCASACASSRDARIAGIVASWPRAASAARAARLGLQPDPDFATIIRQYIADCASHAGRRAGAEGTEASDEPDRPAGPRRRRSPAARRASACAIAERMLRSGASVALWDRDEAPARRRRRAALSALGPVDTRAVELTDDSGGRCRGRGRRDRTRPHRHPRQQRRHHRRQRRRPGSSRRPSGAA